MATTPGDFIGDVDRAISHRSKGDGVFPGKVKPTPPTGPTVANYRAETTIVAADRVQSLSDALNEQVDKLYEPPK